jgi:FkbM family methyltransferase
MGLNSLNVLQKPEYFFRPRQILRRILQGGAPKPEFAETILPWGLKIRFHPKETIGASIWRAGVFDLGVSETIWRLVEPGEGTLDVGANIGYMTGILARRAGRDGSVHAFEPHPEIFEELSRNVEGWKDDAKLAPIFATQVALSDAAGTAELILDESFETNRGTASLRTNSSTDKIQRSVPVNTDTLKGLFEQDRQFGLMKIDVEGHEISVLKGGEDMFRRHRIRDVVFEEHADPPTQVTDFFVERGYTVFFIAKGFLGLNLFPLDTLPERNPFETPNYLATNDPARALALLKPKGWASIGYLDLG